MDTIIQKMKYKNIKNILRKQIDNGVKTFWIFDEENKEFIQIYKMYSNQLRIYTPLQLLEYLLTK